MESMERYLLHYADMSFILTDRYKQRQEQLLKQKLQARQMSKLVGGRPSTTCSQQTCHQLGPWTSGNSEKLGGGLITAACIERIALGLLLKFSFN